MEGESPGPADTFESLEDVEWEEVYPELTLFAIGMLGHKRFRHVAEELVQQAITELIDPNYKDWDPRKESVLKHLKRTVAGLVKNRWRKRSTRNELQIIDASPDFDSDKRVPRMSGAVDDDAAMREMASYIFEELEAAFEPETTEHGVLSLFREQVYDRSEQVARLGLPDAEVRRARLRIARRARALEEGLENPDVDA